MPNQSDLHRNVPLSNLAIAYRNDNEDYICHRIFPVVSVVEDSADFPILDKSNLRREDSRLAPKTRAKLVDWANTWDTYVCKAYALANKIGDDERQNNSVPGNVDTRMVSNIVDRLWADWDYRIAVLLRNVAVWTNSTPAVKWDAGANTTIFADINDARATCVVRKPNTAAMSQETFEALQTAPELLELYKYTSGGMVTYEQIKQLMRVENLLIDRAIINTANQGQADAISYIWSDDVWMGYVAPSVGIDVMSAGWTFRSQDFSVRKMRQDEEWSDLFDCKYKQDEKVVAADLGVLLTNVLG